MAVVINAWLCQFHHTSAEQTRLSLRLHHTTEHCTRVWGDGKIAVAYLSMCQNVMLLVLKNPNLNRNQNDFKIDIKTPFRFNCYVFERQAVWGGGASLWLSPLRNALAVLDRLPWADRQQQFLMTRLNPNNTLRRQQYCYHLEEGNFVSLNLIFVLDRDVTKVSFNVSCSLNNLVYLFVISSCYYSGHRDSRLKERGVGIPILDKNQSDTVVLCANHTLGLSD